MAEVGLVYGVYHLVGRAIGYQLAALRYDVQHILQIGKPLL